MYTPLLKNITEQLLANKTRYHKVHKSKTKILKKEQVSKAGENLKNGGKFEINLAYNPTAQRSLQSHNALCSRLFDARLPRLCSVESLV